MGKGMQIHLWEKTGEGKITISIMLLTETMRTPQNNVVYFNLQGQRSYRVDCSVVSWLKEQATQSFATPNAAIFLLINKLTILWIVLIRCFTLANTTTSYCIPGLHPVLCGERQVCSSLRQNTSVHFEPMDTLQRYFIPLGISCPSSRCQS